ncbi:hypothetical protein V8E53_010946 [Lactarius tabidus]
MTNLLQYNVLRCHRRLDTLYPKVSATRQVSLDPPNSKTRLSQRRITYHSVTDLCRGTSASANENPSCIVISNALPSPLSQTVTSTPPLPSDPPRPTLTSYPHRQRHFRESAFSSGKLSFVPIRCQSVVQCRRNSQAYSVALGADRRPTLHRRTRPRSTAGCSSLIQPLHLLKVAHAFPWHGVWSAAPLRGAWTRSWCLRHPEATWEAHRWHPHPGNVIWSFMGSRMQRTRHVPASDTSTWNFIVLVPLGVQRRRTEHRGCAG